MGRNVNLWLPSSETSTMAAMDERYSSDCICLHFGYNCREYVVHYKNIIVIKLGQWIIDL